MSLLRFVSARSIALPLRGIVPAVLLLSACSGKIDTTPSPAPSSAAPSAPKRPPATAPEPGAEAPPREATEPVVVDLGVVGYGQDVTLNVPTGALGFNVVVASVEAAADVVGIERITSPSGEVVHDGYTPKGGSHATSQSSFRTIASASVPQSEATSANPPEPGAWVIRIGGHEPSPPPPLDGGGGGGGNASLHVEARIQMGSTSGFAGGRLDMNVFVPPGLKLEGTTLDSTSAASDEGIESRLHAFYTALEARVGIDRGDVRFFPVKAELQFVDDEALLVDAFSASAGRPDTQALNVMLTNGIDFGDGNGAWGIAPGIPGAGARAGTPMSGIVLAVGDTPAVGDGLTILHEGGHFIGLNHTTELYDGLADPLSDTPKCETISLDDPSTLQACPDRTNIMFPAFYGTAGSAVDVSNAQRAVYRGSPIYKAYKSAVTAKGTRGLGSISLASLARPGERITLTKSGRALTPVETWLSASLCSHAKLDASALARAHGRDALITALRSAAADADLPDVMRRKAKATLHAVLAMTTP